MKKKRKLSLSSPLPVDCVGEIVHFLHLTTTFFKIYGLSQHVKWYLENENPETTEHIKFVAKKGVVVESEKKYVKWLRLHDEIPLKFFPRVKTLEFDFKDRVRQFSENYFNILPSLRQLENFVVKEGILTDDHLVFFSNLKKLGIPGQRDITDDGLTNLENVEDLNISNTGKKQKKLGDCFEKLKNLRSLNVTNCNLNLNSAILCFPRLRELKIMYNDFLTDANLKSLTMVERLNINNCKNITDIGLQYLPENLRELSCYGNDVSNIGISRFKGIEVLEYPFFNTRVTVDVLKQFKNIKNLSVSLDHHASFQQVIESTFTSLEKLKIIDCCHESEVLTDDDMKKFRKFPNLLSLTMWCDSLSDKGLKNIAQSCKNLRKLVLLGDSGRITDEGLKQLNFVGEVILKKNWFSY